MTKKKKVILLGKLPPPYMGPAIATKILLESDLCNQFEIIFLNTKANDSINTLGKWSFGKIFKNISLYFKLAGLILRNKPDLVLIPISQTTSGFIKDSFYILIARLLGRKVLLQLRGSNFKNWLTASSGFVKGYVKFVLKRTNGIIVLGNKLKYLFADYFPQEKIFVVPNGADYIIPKMKRSSEEVKIIYLSNLLSSKGIEDVFDAVNILYQENKNFSVDLIGEWLHEETKKYCLELMQKNKLPIRIHTSEASKDKLRFLASADIFVFPPREPEGHPWAIVEAMAAGLPVISTDKGAITESVKDGINGYIVGPKHPEQIAEKLQTLIADKNLREKMGKESRDLYLKEFTEAKMVEKLAKVFYTIIEEK
jgi:glycosyltransferase involved in cell wall biosynthesis